MKQEVTTKECTTKSVTHIGRGKNCLEGPSPSSNVAEDVASGADLASMLLKFGGRLMVRCHTRTILNHDNKTKVAVREFSNWVFSVHFASGSDRVPCIIK